MAFSWFRELPRYDLLEACTNNRSSHVTWLLFSMTKEYLKPLNHGGLFKTRLGALSNHPCVLIYVPIDSTTWYRVQDTGYRTTNQWIYFIDISWQKHVSKIAIESSHLNYWKLPFISFHSNVCTNYFLYFWSPVMKDFQNYHGCCNQHFPCSRLLHQIFARFQK